MLRGACAATKSRRLPCSKPICWSAPGRNPDSRRFPDAALAGYHPHSPCPRASPGFTDAVHSARFFPRGLNSFGLPARADEYLVVDSVPALQARGAAGALDGRTRLLLGGGSNLIFGGDFHGLVLKVAIEGRRLVHEDADAWYVEAGGGENWHDFVRWTLRQGWPGLENLP